MANVYDINIRPIITVRSMAATNDNTINYDGKTKRMGAGRPGTRKSW
mgnify:CR=1 FL=1